jgi:hypothetical protein
MLKKGWGRGNGSESYSALFATRLKKKVAIHVISNAFRFPMKD